MSCPNPLTKYHPPAAGSLERIGPLLGDAHPDLVLSKRRLRKVESIECVRLKRESARQNLGFTSRPFVLCGLPVKRPAEGCLLHERRNGQFSRQRGLHSIAPPRCWTRSACSREVHNIAA
jgi:hypothetical protein